MSALCTLAAAVNWLWVVSDPIPWAWRSELIKLIRADSKAPLPLGLQEAGASVAVGGWVGKVVEVGGFVGCVVAVGGAEVLVAALEGMDGIKVAEGARVVKSLVAEAVLHKELVGLAPGVEDSDVASVVVVAGWPVSVDSVSEGLMEDSGEGVTVTGSGSKGV